MSNDDDDDNNHFPCDALETDNYNGILLKVDKAADDERFQSPDRFQSILEASLGQWKEEGKRGIWVYLPTRMAHLVPVSGLCGDGRCVASFLSVVRANSVWFEKGLCRQWF